MIIYKYKNKLQSLLYIYIRYAAMNLLNGKSISCKLVVQKCPLDGKKRQILGFTLLKGRGIFF